MCAWHGMPEMVGREGEKAGGVRGRKYSEA